MTKSISAHLDKTFCIEHNNRLLISKNVDPERSENNYYKVASGQYDENGTYYAKIEEIFDKVFEPG